MCQTLDQLFAVQVSDDRFEVQPYTELLNKVADSCPEANIVRESQQWSRIHAAERGDCTIYDPSELQGDELPFDPSQVAVQIAYYKNSDGEFDLAWVATWPYEEM